MVWYLYTSSSICGIISKKQLTVKVLLEQHTIYPNYGMKFNESVLILIVVGMKENSVYEASAYSFAMHLNVCIFECNLNYELMR